MNSLRRISFIVPLVVIMVLLGCGHDRPSQPETQATTAASDSILGSLPPVGLPQDYGWVNYPINPWLPLNALTFGVWREGHGWHLGDDCKRNPNTPIYAIRSGYVRYARYQGPSWGYLMIVESQVNNIAFCTVYGHMGSAMYPGEGQWVSTGQYIGTVGSTQQSGQPVPHLHLGIHYGWYNAPTGVYAPWCQGYNWNGTNGWFNPTAFMAYW